MSNHCHIVLHNNLSEARRWSDDAVIGKWYQLLRGSLQSQWHIYGLATLQD